MHYFIWIYTYFYNVYLSYLSIISIIHIISTYSLIGEYYALHIRRGDFQFKEVKISAAQIVENLHFKNGENLLIDRQKDRWMVGLKNR